MGGANTFTGAVTISGGVLTLANSQALGTTAATGVTVAAGAALDLGGQTTTVAKTLTINGNGNTTTNTSAGVTGIYNPNTLGALINSSASAASYAGNVVTGNTQTSAFILSVGGPSLVAGVNGGITLSGSIASGGGGALALTKIGGNNLTLTNGSVNTSTFDLQAGSLTFSGAGLMPSASAANFVRQNTTLTLDNTGTAVSNRLGNRGLWLSGSLVITGNSSTAVTEAINTGGNNFAVGGGTTNNSGGNNTATFANGYGGSTITINATGTAGVTLQVASTSTSLFNRGQGSSMVIAADNLGGTPGSGTATIVGNGTSLGNSANNGQSTGQTGAWGTANTYVYPWAVVSTSASGLPTAFAGYNGTTNGIAPLTGTNGNAANAVTAIPSAVIGASANTTNTNATVNINTSGLGLSVGMEVLGAGIAAGTTISSFTATTVVLSANATATANTQLTFLSPVTGGLAVPNVVATSATNVLSSITTAQSINSLTLNNVGNSSTLTINPASLQIDSGGILAVGNNSATTNYTINGPGTLTGTNTLARELIFHVVGSNTTLTVNAPIFGNQNIGNGLLNANNGTAPPNVGLTKADGGTLVLGALETYTGDTVINGGTLRLAGGNNTIFRPFTTAPTPGNSGATSTFQNVTVTSGGTLDLNGNNQTFGNLRSGSGTQLAGGTIINSNATASTLSVALNTSQTWAGNISNGQSIGTVTSNSVGLTGSASGGTLNFVRDGNSTLTINSPNTLGGSVTILGGATRLIDLGTFQNASAINITDSVLIWDNSGVQGVSNRLSSTAPINLTGGGFQFVSRAGTGSNPVDAISLGTLNLGLGNNSINPTTVGQGGVSQITFAGLGTRATSATLSFNGGNAAGLVLGDNPKVFFTSAPTLTNGLIGPWATASGIGAQTVAFATYDPATGVRPLQYTSVNTFGSGQNTLVNANVTLPAPISSTGFTTTTNSVTAQNATLSFTNPNDTLIIQSGGITDGANNNFNFGTTTVPGQIQSGAGNDLYVNLVGSTMTFNSKIIDNGSNNNVIFATVNGNNTPAATLTNANTYGGTTYVNGVNLNLNSLLGPAILGNVILSGGNSQGDSLAYDQSSLNWSASNQLATTANITMNGATRLNLGNSTSALPNQNFSNTQTINNLTFNNIGGTNGLNGPTVFTGAGALTINGTLSSTSAAVTATVPTINGFLVLGNGATSGSTAINVDPNQYIPNNVGLNINANIALGSNTSFTKTGLGYLGIGGQSQNLIGTTFNLNAGGLAFSPSTGSAQAILGSAVVMAANTIIDTRGSNTGSGYAGLVLGSVASTNTSAVIMNGVQGTSGNLSTGLDNSSTSYAGSFSSPYPTGLLNVTKIGTGTWTLTGNSNTSANGTLTVQAGNVIVNSTGVENFQSYTLNTSGTLLLDNGTTAQNNRLGGAFYTTIGTTVPTVRTLNMQGGNLTVNGNSGAAVSEALGTVNLTGGGIITLNAASTAGVNLTLQSFATQGGQTSLLIRGDNLGSAVGANNAAVTFATAGATGTTPGLAVFGGGGANGTFTRSIRPDILVDPSATGNGTSFLTADSVSGLVRPLAASELAITLNTTTAANTNVSLNSTAYGAATPVTAAFVSGGALGATSVTVSAAAAATLAVGETITGTGLANNTTITAINLGTGALTLSTPTTAQVAGTLTVASNSLFTGNFAANATNSVASLTLQSGGGVNLAIVPTNPFGANGALLSFANTVSGGVLNLAGNNTITAGQYSYGTQTQDFHVLTGSTLTLNAQIGGTSGGLTKADGGTLVLNGPFTGNNAQLITINGGTLQFGGTSASISTVTTAGTSATVPLGSNIQVGSIVTGTGITAGTRVTAYNASTGAVTLSQAATAGTNNLTYAASAGSNGSGVNPLYVYINSGGAPSSENLAINNGTLDLNGTSQLFGTLTSQNPLPNSNIVITNTNATTTSTFTTNGAASVFSGSFQGNLNLDKAGNSTTFGNNTMTLSSAQTYTGTTTIRVGALVLRDSATLASPTINANFAELTLDNSGLSLNNARISSTAAVNLNGGALRINTSSAASTQNFGTITLNGGSNLFYVNEFGNNTQDSAPTFNIANLVVNNGSTLDLLVAPNGTAGSFSGASGHVFISQLNGAAFSAANLVNGIIGPQYVVYANNNQFNWASYSNLGGVTTPNVTIGGITTPNYGALGGGITANANVNANAQSVAGQTLNTLFFGNPAAATTLGLNGPTDQLVLAGGGLLVSNSNSQTIGIQGGSITAGSLNTPSTLYLQVGTQNTLTINTPIVNNGATLNGTTGLWSGGTGALSLTRSTGSLTVTLTPQVVESLTTTQLPANSTTITVPSATGLFIGMAVSGTGITTGSTITGIAGNVITLSAATSTTANSATSQVTFAAAANVAATASTTQGSTTVTTPANNFATGFTPAVGMNIGGANIPGGTTITAVSGTNAAGFTLTLSQAALATSATNSLTVGAINNAYTGTTTINSSTDIASGGTTNLSGVAGSIVIPGNLTINGGATVTMNTNQGQIASTSAVTINGSGTLTLVGTNRFSAPLTFNNSGGNAVPTVNVGTLLDYSSASAISANNDNTGFTPLITGGTVNFSNATGTTINVTGASLNDLSIASQITTNAIGTTTPNAGAVLTKTGAGSLILPNANAASLTWALNGGSIFVGNATALGVNASAGALSLSGNIGLASGVAGNTGIALPTIFTAPTTLSLANGFSGSGVNLSGGMNLNGQNPTLTVPLASQTSNITGQITGTGGFSKAGSGLLTLTPATASTFTGPVVVAGGLITLGNANGLAAATGTGTNVAADVTVGTTAEINIAAFPQNFGSLAGGGIVTNSGAAAALTLGNASNATNATFSGSLVAATAANLSVIKTGTTNQTLSGQSYYTGVTTVSAGTLTLANGATGNLASTGNSTTPTVALTAAQTPTLADTAITVASGATLSINSLLQNAATQSTVTVLNTVLSGGVTMNNVTIGNTTTAGATASLAIAAGGAFNFSNAETTLTQLNINGGASTLVGLTSAGATSTLGFNIGNNGADLINLTGKATITGGTINLTALSGATSIPIGLIPLIENAGAGFTGVFTSATSANNFTLGTTSLSLGGHNYTLAFAPAAAGTLGTSTVQTALVVTVQAPTTAFWTGAQGSAGSGIWNTGNSTGVTNWNTGVSNGINTQASPGIVSGSGPTAVATNVYFNTTTPTAANLNTTTGAATTINSLNFIGTATAPVAIADGGTAANNLTILANASYTDPTTSTVQPLGTGINVASGAGAATIGANVVLGNSQTWTTATGTTLNVNGNATSGTITGSGNNLTLAGSGTINIGAAIQTGAGTLTNTSGTTVLTGTNTYTGATNVNGGTLQVGVAGAGSTSATSAVTVNGSGAVLAGTGTVGGATTITLGQIRPGDPTTSLGTLTLSSSLAVGSTGTISQGLKAPGYQDPVFAANKDLYINALAYLEAAKTAAGNDAFASAVINSWKTPATTANNSFININGTLNLDASSTLQLTNSGYASGTMMIGDVFNLMDWSGVRTSVNNGGTLGNLTLPSAFATSLSAAGLSFDTSAYSTYGVVVVVPEPSRVLLLFLGLAALFMRRRRK